MTYTGSNQSFVTNILKPFFQQTGLSIPDELFNKIVERICTDNGYTVLNAASSHDFITQKGLNLLSEIQNDKNLHM